jgi:hypothetical protein
MDHTNETSTTDNAPQKVNNYNTYILNGSQINTYIDTTSNLNKFLDNEKDNVHNVDWNKMSKMNKLSKIDEYIILKYPTISDEFKEKVLKYLKDCIDKKKMNRVEDVLYDKAEGVIKKITELQINIQLKTYSYKNNERKKSTLKNLPPKKH